MTADAFSHVTHWVFDLDNTLYPPAARLFDQIERRMTDFIVRELKIEADHANELRKTYWARHGTTLAGLMAEHDMDPMPFLDDVHQVDMTHLDADPALDAALRKLPGRRIVYTNGSAEYAGRVLGARGLSDAIDAVYGIEHADFVPKPEARAFDRVFGLDGVPGPQAAMFEDDARNLAAPHQMGLRTVHVAPDPVRATHIHHHTDDLTGFLNDLTHAA